MKLKLFLITLLSLTLLGSTLAIGTDVYERIEAIQDDRLNFTVDGESWYPADVDGTPLTPILYRDRTYIPVRALLEHKGVDVDYLEDTRTVLLDFTKIETTYQPQKSVDKSTPLLYQNVTEAASSATGGGSGKVSITTFSRNPDFLDPDDDGDGIPTYIEYTYDLDSDADIIVDGETLRLSLEELVHSESLWLLEAGGQVALSYDPDVDMAITGIDIHTHHDDASDVSIEMASKIDIEVEISGPPFKITVRIKF